MEIKNKIIRLFGLKGSWSWAKKQMRNGKVVRCKHWTGSLKLRIDSLDNTRLLSTWSHEANDTKTMHYVDTIWESSIHFINYEDDTDYEIVDGWDAW